MSALHPLFELQRLDLTCDALLARRTGLAERAQLRDCEAASSALALERAEAEARLAALEREERRLEAEVTDARAKAHETEATLYSGRIKVVKELEALQTSLRELKRSQGEHEDAELALMAQEEELSSGIAALEARREALGREADALRSAIGSAEAEIGGTLAELAVERTALLPRVAPAVLAKYEKLRAAPLLKGKAAVRIEGGSCGGCRGAIPIALASRFAGEDANATTECPRCARILLH